jgi:hypothetical protein
MSKSNSKDFHASFRFDAVLNNQIEAYEKANGLNRPDAIRQMLSEKCNDLSAELLRIKTATNISAVEASETRKHVSKVVDILVTKIPAIDGNIETLSSRMKIIEETNKVICDLLIKIYNRK